MLLNKLVDAVATDYVMTSSIIKYCYHNNKLLKMVTIQAQLPQQKHSQKKKKTKKKTAAKR